MQYLDRQRFVLVLGNHTSANLQCFYSELWNQMQSGNECLLVQFRAEETLGMLIKQFSNMGILDYYSAKDEEECRKIAQKINSLPLHQVVHYKRKINFHNLLKTFVKSRVKHIFIQGFDLTEKGSDMFIAMLCEFARKNKCYIMVEAKHLKDMEINSYMNKIDTLIELNLISQEFNTIFVKCKDGYGFVECITPGSTNNTILGKFKRR